MLLSSIGSVLIVIESFTAGTRQGANFRAGIKTVFPLIRPVEGDPATDIRLLQQKSGFQSLGH